MKYFQATLLEPLFDVGVALVEEVQPVDARHVVPCVVPVRVDTLDTRINSAIVAAHRLGRSPPPVERRHVGFHSFTMKFEVPSPQGAKHLGNPLYGSDLVIEQVLHHHTPYFSRKPKEFIPIGIAPSSFFEAAVSRWAAGVMKKPIIEAVGVKPVVTHPLCHVAFCKWQLFHFTTHAGEEETIAT